MNRSVIIYGNELYHHGIKGQKWGVRRYQNEDGTLTEAGRRRYARDIHQKLVDNEKNYTSAKRYENFFGQLADSGDGDQVIAGSKGIFEELNGMTVSEAAQHFNKKAKAAEAATWKMLSEAANNGIDVDITKKTAKQVRREALGLALATDFAIGASVVGLAVTTGIFVPVVPFVTPSNFYENGEEDVGRTEYKVKRRKKTGDGVGRVRMLTPSSK